MDVVGQSHIVSGFCTVSECCVVVCSCLKTVVAVSLDVVSHHLYLSNTCNGVWGFVYFVYGIVACSEQREAVILQAQYVHTLERVDNLRIVDGMLSKAIARDIGATEALCIRQVSVAEDTTLAVILIEHIILYSRQTLRRCSASLEEVFVLQRYVAIGILVFIRVVIVLVVIFKEVGTLRQLYFLHILMGDGDMLTVLIVANEDYRVAAEAGSGAIGQTAQLRDLFMAGGEGMVYIVFVGKLQHGGVVCQYRRALGDGISSAIHSLVDVDMHVLPTNRWRLGYLGKIIISVVIRYLNTLSVAIVYRCDILVCALSDEIIGKEIDMLLDGRRLFCTVIVFEVEILLVGTVQYVPAANVILGINVIVDRIAHLHVCRAIYISGIGTARNGTEYMSVKNINIGNADNITLLSATIYEVGGNTHSVRVVVFVSHATWLEYVIVCPVHLRFRAFYAFTHDDI